MDIRILNFDSVDSTNNVAMDHARKGADEGLCVIASSQTEGRGRYGRRWESPQSAGLYFSAVLRPGFPNEHFPLITLAAAVAVHDTLSDLGVSADIKWPNDLLVDDRKISGILAETFETPRGPAVILGIGINLFAGQFGDGIRDIATSVESVSGSSPDRNEVEALLVKYLFFHYPRLVSESGREEVVSEWSRRSSFARGKLVRAEVSGSVSVGTTDGITSKGALRIRTDTGVTLLEAGEVTRVRS